MNMLVHRVTEGMKGIVEPMRRDITHLIGGQTQTFVRAMNANQENLVTESRKRAASNNASRPPLAQKRKPASSEQGATTAAAKKKAEAAKKKTEAAKKVEEKKAEAAGKKATAAAKKAMAEAKKAAALDVVEEKVCAYAAGPLLFSELCPRRLTKLLIPFAC